MERIKEGAEGRERNITLEPLSPERLNDALAVFHAIFPSKLYGSGEDTGETLYRASLEPEKYKDALERMDIERLSYWVALNRGEIVGVTGLYKKKQDPESVAWLGWYGVSPDKRGAGIGKKILELTTEKAKALGYAALRLYTSTAPAEAAAQDLYEKFGFEITATEDVPEASYDIIYREKDLLH